MKDFEKQIEKLERDAVDCDLIAQLATDESKRNTFSNLAARYREMAKGLKSAMALLDPAVTEDQPPPR